MEKKYKLDPLKTAPHSENWGGWQFGMVAIHYGEHEGEEKALLVDNAAADMFNAPESKVLPLKVALHPSNVGHLLEMVERAWYAWTESITVSRETLTIVERQMLGARPVRVSNELDRVYRGDPVQSLCQALLDASTEAQRRAELWNRLGWQVNRSVRGIIEHPDSPLQNVSQSVWGKMRRIEDTTKQLEVQSD